jgi:hypothetical protein
LLHYLIAGTSSNNKMNTQGDLLGGLPAGTHELPDSLLASTEKLEVD